MVLVGSGYSPSAVASGAECQLKDKMGSDELDHSFFILFFVAKTKVLSAFLKIFFGCSDLFSEASTVFIAIFI